VVENTLLHLLIQFEEDTNFLKNSDVIILQLRTKNLSYLYPKTQCRMVQFKLTKSFYTEFTIWFQVLETKRQ